MENIQKDHRNRDSILEEEDIEERSNNNIIEHCIRENTILKETNYLLNKQVKESNTTCKIEKIKVEEIETCLQSMEKDYDEALRAGDDKTQALKEESH